MTYTFEAVWGKNFKGVVASPTCNGPKTYEQVGNPSFLVDFDTNTGVFTVLYDDSAIDSYNLTFEVDVYCNGNYQGTYTQIVNFHIPTQSVAPFIFDDLVQTYQTVITGKGVPNATIKLYIGNTLQTHATITVDSNGNWTINSNTFAGSDGIDFGQTLKAKQTVPTYTESGFSNSVTPSATLKSDIEVHNPIVNCSNGILTFKWLVKNLGPVSLQSGVEVTLTASGVPVGGVFSCDKGTVVTNVITLNQKVYKNETFDVVYVVSTNDCGQVIENILLKVTLPVSIENPCENNEHQLVSYIPLKSNIPTLLDIYTGQIGLIGYGVPGSTITKVYVNDKLVLVTNAIVNSDGTFTVNGVSPIPVEGDRVSVIQKTEGYRESNQSNIVIVGGPIQITSKCLSGVRIRGVDGITYEAIVMNYSKNKIMGRQVFVGAQMGQHIFFNEPGLSDADLQVGDALGIEVKNPCCPPMFSKKIPYNPLRSLLLNYSCRDGSASINPIFSGGNYPITMTLKLGDLIVGTKILYNVTQDRELLNIPISQNLQLILKDSGFCEIFSNFSNNCSTTTTVPGTPSNCSDCILENIQVDGGNLKLNFTLSGSSCTGITIQSSLDQINWIDTTSDCKTPKTVVKPGVKTYYRLLVACTGSTSKKSNVLAYNPAECINYFAITNKTVVYLDCNTNQKTTKGPCNFSATQILQGVLGTDYSTGHQSGQPTCTDNIPPTETPDSSYYYDIDIYKSQAGSWLVNYVDALGNDRQISGTIDESEVSGPMYTQQICAKSIDSWFGSINVTKKDTTCNAIN